MAGGIIGALRVTLGLDTAAFESGATRAERRAEAMGNRAEALGYKVGRLGKVLAGAGAALIASSAFSAVRDMTKSGLELASSLGEQATQLGVTSSALQRYRFMATQVGIEQDEMDKGLSKLSLSLGKMALDPDKAAKAMAKYGFDTAEALKLSKMNAEDALPFIADKYQALSSDTERAALVAELFGSKMGAKFKTLLEGGSKGINDMADAYKRLNIEISPEQIAKADAAMDQMAANQKAIDAQIAKSSADAAPQIAKAEMAWAQMKLNALKIFADTVTGLENFNRDYYSKYVKWAGDLGRVNLTGGLTRSYGEYVAWAQGVGAQFRSVAASAAQMVSDVSASMAKRLPGIMDRAKAKFHEVKDAAFDMWDKVTRRSYVPDMVDDIAREMARLDGVMVNPAKTATGKTKDAFQQLATEVKGIVESLMPEVRDLREYRDKVGTIDAGQAKGLVSGALGDELRARAAAGPRMSVAEIYGLGPNDSIAIPQQVRDALAKIAGVTSDNADKTEAANVRIAKSFKDMAEETLSRLNGLASAIKSGGFLGILDAVIGLGLQLGGIGAFGKGIAARINSAKVPAYAGGTGFHPGGLALVGERGPELVNLPRGAQVWPNGSGPGGGIAQIVPSPYFDVVVDGRVMRAAPGIASAGARAGVGMMSYRQSRRVA